MPPKPQNIISQTGLNNYNQLRSVITKNLRRLKITTNAGNKIRVYTTVKERDKQLLDLITINLLKIEKQHSSDQEIITLPMIPIVSSSFNKHPTYR